MHVKQPPPVLGAWPPAPGGRGGAAPRWSRAAVRPRPVHVDEVNCVPDITLGVITNSLCLSSLFQ